MEVLLSVGHSVTSQKSKYQCHGKGTIAFCHSEHICDQAA